LHLCHGPEDQAEDTVPRGDGQGARGREYDNEGQQFHRLSYRQPPQKLQHAEEGHMTTNVRAIGGALGLIVTIRHRRDRVSEFGCRADGRGRRAPAGAAFAPDLLWMQALPNQWTSGAVGFQVFNLDGRS
jgi:hypothetical protein